MVDDLLHIHMTLGEMSGIPRKKNESDQILISKLVLRIDRSILNCEDHYLPERGKTLKHSEGLKP